MTEEAIDHDESRLSKLKAFHADSFRKTQSSENFRDRRVSLLNKIFRSSQYYKSSNQLNKIIGKLRLKCFSSVKDYHKLHMYRKSGVNVIRDVLKHVDVEDLRSIRVIHVVWGYMSCLHHFQSRLVLNYGLVSWSRHKEYLKVEALFDEILNYMSVERKTLILSSVLTFFKVGKLWENEEVCIFVLKKTIKYAGNIEEALLFIINVAEQWSLEDLQQSRNVVILLYQIMAQLELRELSDVFLERLIMILQSSIDPSPQNIYNYEPFREGVIYCLKLCIQNFIPEKRIHLLEIILKMVQDEDLSDEAIIDFGLLAENAAFRLMHESPTNMPPIILSLVFDFIESPETMICMLGLVVYQNLWDKHVNRPYLSAPIIFQDKENYRLTYSLDTVQAREYFSVRLRDMFQTKFLECLQNHPNNQTVLENVFTCIALNICDLPTGLVASSAACLVMKIQDYAISNDERFTLQYEYHLHAMVASVLSLISFIFQADALGGYINKIISARAKYAPHLNPPLRQHYEFAAHHILWPFSDFFFEDWELRYGLWKCFREQKETNLRPSPPRQELSESETFKNARYSQILSSSQVWRESERKSRQYIQLIVK